MNMEEGVNSFKITCQHCNGFVTFSVRSGELIYITFSHDELYTIGLYPEELVPENFNFW